MPMRGQRVAFHSEERSITESGTVNGTAGDDVRRETASCVQCAEQSWNRDVARIMSDW